MSDLATQHLTADELDALIAGIGSPRALSHSATCPTCHEMLLLDRQVVELLGRLPILEPMADFEERVMARVNTQPRPAHAVVPLRTPREVAARRRLLGLTLAASGATAGGLVWAAADPLAAHGLSTAAFGGMADSLWLSLQTIVANTSEQPWFGALRDAAAAPARLLPLLAAGAAAYTVALLGLGRLLAEPATDAAR